MGNRINPVFNRIVVFVIAIVAAAHRILENV